MSKIGGPEEDRLEALRRYQILDSSPDVPFERITRLAARLFVSPIALVSLVDQERVWFKARYGTITSEIPRMRSFCNLAIEDDAVLVVPDTNLDERFAIHPLGPRGRPVGFYAGAPLVTLDRFHIGTLCIMDLTPRRDFIREHQRTLMDLAAITMDAMDLRVAYGGAEQPRNGPMPTEGGKSVRSRKEEEVSITLLGDLQGKRVAYLSDLSDSGMGVVSDLPLPQGAQVLIEGNELAVRGEVRYSYRTSEGYQIGIHALEVVNAGDNLTNLTGALNIAEEAHNDAVGARPRER